MLKFEAGHNPLFSVNDIVDPVTIELRFLQRLQVRLGSHIED